MSTHRTLPAPVAVVAAVMLAVPLVLLHGTYRSAYPLLLLVGVAVRTLAGRAVRVATLLLAFVVGPFVWHLGAEQGAAETVAVMRDAGLAGLAEYTRDVVLAGAPLRAWLVLPCLFLLGFVVADLVAWAVPRMVAPQAVAPVRAGAATLAAGIALLLPAPLVSLRAGEMRSAWLDAERARDEERQFLAHVDAGLPRLARTRLTRKRDVDVVLYVGESTSRWDWSLYGYPRATTAALDSGIAGDRLVVFTQAVAAPRGSGDAPADGPSSLPFLYRAQGDLVVPLRHTAARAGVQTVWLNGAGTPWAADTAVTGAMRVASAAQYDGELLAPLRDLLDGASGSRLVVVETHAGRYPWCGGIPAAHRTRWDDWIAQLPDVAVWGDGAPRRASLNCYDSAMHYAARTLRGAMQLVDRAARPTVLVYVANRGEDAWGRLRGEGVARSHRVTDVPLLLYENPAFASRYPGALAAARRNREPPVTTAWLHDALLDLFDVPTVAGAPVVDSTTSVIASARDTVSCAHRANSLFKYLEGMRVYGCAELDVVLDAGSGPAFVYHPPARNGQLPLYAMLRRAGVPRHGVWLDVKNLDERNAPSFLARLTVLVPPAARGGVLVETSNDELARSPAARAFGDSGFVLTYYLPTDLGCVCSRGADGACARETDRLVRLLDGGAFHGISFDARGRALARTLRDRFAPRPALNAWRPMDRCANGDPPTALAPAALDTLRGEVQKYLVRMSSSFTH